MRRRIISIFLLLLLSLGGVAAKLFFLQIQQRDRLAERATKQYQRLLPIVSRRGTIYDRAGRELAVSLKVPSVFAQPAAVEDPAETAKALAPILEQPARDILARLTADKPFVWMQRQMDPAKGEAITDLNLKGIGLYPESRRYYPRQELAAHVLGMMGVDDRGLEGLEHQYDDLLGGQPQFVAAQQDALGRVIFRQEEPERRAPVFDLILTIDEVIQYIAERELQRAVERSRAKAGTAIVMDPWTGEILALANQPTYDPNNYQKSGAAARRDRAVTDAFEPGSVFKVILAAGGLEEGVIRPGDRFFGENGAIEVSGVTIRDHEKHGWLTVREILTQSSNVGAIKIGQKLGKSLYYHYISSFGFGSLTGLDLPGETPGLMRRPKSWSALSLSVLSMGQEISVTPVQIATAFSAVANGGNLVRPHVVHALKVQDGSLSREVDPGVIRRVISAETAQTLLEMLRGVVEDGTGKEAALEEYTVAGKTGTAQKMDPATGRYSHQKIVASFVGAVPAESPRLVILVLIDEPEALRWGGSIAAPTFREIARDALQYLQVPPSPSRDVRLVRSS
ncbi:MAG: penicillin-binding transpeptidase domain-containing protein [Candidatus Methylomirabilota bacterium]|jgi:cell division protein FtsI (penicillin-binding protein 3)